MLASLTCPALGGVLEMRISGFCATHATREHPQPAPLINKHVYWSCRGSWVDFTAVPKEMRRPSETG